MWCAYLIKNTSVFPTFPAAPTSLESWVASAHTPRYGRRVTPPRRAVAAAAVAGGEGSAAVTTVESAIIYVKNYDGNIQCENAVEVSRSCSDMARVHRLLAVWTCAVVGRQGLFHLHPAPRSPQVQQNQQQHYTPRARPAPRWRCILHAQAAGYSQQLIIAFGLGAFCTQDFIFLGAFHFNTEWVNTYGRDGGRDRGTTSRTHPHATTPEPVAVQ